MQKHLKTSDLAVLLDILKNPVFYILGAGVSSEVVPFTSDLKKDLIANCLKRSCISVEPPNPPDKVHETIIDTTTFLKEHSKTSYEHTITLAKVMRISNFFVHSWTYHLLSPRLDTKCPFSYALIALAHPSVIWNMNTDGLAHQWCKNHLIFEPHGRIPASLVRSPKYAELFLDPDFDFDLQPPDFGALLPQPEPPNITSKHCYQEVKKYFNRCRWVIIIGYSFGASNFGIADYETFSFLTDLFRYYQKRVVVIDPDPMKTGILLEEALKQKVEIVPIYLDCFAKALFSLRFIGGQNNFKRATYKLDLLHYLYQHYEYIRNIQN